VRASMLG